MRLRDLERHLEAQGCEKIREGGRHTIWASAADRRRRAAVPRHREIDRVLARAICRQLGAADPQL